MFDFNFHIMPTNFNLALDSLGHGVRILFLFHIICLFCFSQVLDFFNSRIDAQHTDGEWSVEKVLQVIVANSWSWRG